MSSPESSSVKSAADAAPAQISEFDALLGKELKIRDTQKQSAVQMAVRTLSQQALASSQVISSDVVKTISAIIAEIDRKLSEQINKIMHHDDFKTLEGTWRGLHHLVNNTETDEMLKIRVLNVSKNDLKKSLKKFEGNAWDQSPLFKKLYDEEFGTPGGQPYGCIVGDFQFDHSPEDVKMLSNIAQVASAMHAPFIAGAAPSVMSMDSWQELSNPRDLSKAFQTADYAAWRSLRDSDDSKYLPFEATLWCQVLARGGICLRGGDGECRPQQIRLVECRLCDGIQHHSIVQALRLVRMHPRYRIGWHGGGSARTHLPDGRWRRRHEVSDRDCDHGSAGSGAGQEWLHAAVSL